MKIQVEIDDAELMSCVESACGSVTYGIGYWAKVNTSIMIGSNASCYIVQDRDDDQHHWHILDEILIRRGVKLLAKDFPHKFAQLLEGNADGPLGDLIIQLAIFGEEKYA